MKCMKLNIWTILTTSMILFGSCNEQDEIGTPVQTGDEINFGIAAPDKVDTRTSYGNPTQDKDGNWYFPVYWEQDDEIAVFCPQASQPASQLVDYKITPDSDNPATSSAVTKIGDGAGLQWGSSDEHRFYGFYPASAVLGTETDGRIKGNIPVEQKVVEWVENKAEDGTTTYNGVPDTDLAYMFAYTSVKKSELVNNPDIPLKFKPLVTILEIIVNGPAENSSPIQVSNINVTGVSGNVALAGNFECLISDQSGKCTPLEDGTVTNRISISCFDNDKNQFITLKHGDKINVKAFIIPNEQSIGTRQISITVSTVNGGAKTKTLKTDEIVAHKVNRVSLPALTSGGSNYWMSNLDRNIYASELSLPGSKFAYATPENGVSVRNFQNATITEQFQAGVRAFIVQTAGYAEYRRKNVGSYRNPSYEYTHLNEGKDELYVTVNGSILNKNGKDVTIEDVLTELKACIDDAKAVKGESNNEYVVVQLTYEGAPCNSNYSNFDSERIWIEALQAKLNSLKENNTYSLYTDEITANTTIANLREHIVLKVNYNSTTMGGYIDVNATIPALFSRWQGKYGDVNLRWGTPNETATRTPMHWLYQEATHVGSNTEITYDEKETYIRKVFDDGVTRYQQNTAHDTWFMNDIGGRYLEDTNDAVTRLTTELNNYSVGLLQERTANASLGLVFMNFADKKSNSGALYQSDWLIQTIIDNNFKFALRKASSGTTTYDASYISGGNVIE